MDANVMFTEEKRAERVLEALRSNRMEAYFVNNTASVIYGNYHGGFDEEFIVFDIYKLK